MHPFQRVALLVVLIVVVLVTALFSAARLYATRGKPRTRALRWMSITSLSLLAIGLGCLGYGLLIEADWLEVTRLTVETAKWPRGKTLRIAHFSDLHTDRESRAQSHLAELIREEKPDLIVFAGDTINAPDGAPIARSLLGGLQAPLGRVAVRGNHDVYRWNKIDLFGGGIARELMTDAPLLLDEGRVAVCGAPFGAVDGVEGCLKASPKDALNLFVYHSPDLVELLEPQPDLYLAGHTHGGQVALPFYGALITMSGFDKRYEAGRYQFGKTTLYVNRGIGFEPHFLRVRFFARPELTIIDVVGTGG